jgi:transglutaminase-like putative cysteine protease
MTRYLCVLFFSLLPGFITTELFSQNNLPFGDITLEELSNKQYKPDPGADAIIVSDIGIARLGYDNDFYIELERDVRIRIVNSNGFDYANIKIPFLADDRLIKYSASTFNTRNGEKIETKIPKKSFITENTSKSYRTLMFNFPDVHEGSVIEYSYVIRLKNYSLYVLVPWKFQSDIPVIYSSITVVYPNSFTYKNIISGSAMDVNIRTSTSNTLFFGESVTTNIRTWSAKDIPAFRDEPDILSRKEHLTKITFELERVQLPNSSLKEITPTYATLTEKLLERTDFGSAANTNLRSLAENLTKDQKDDLSKLKKIHEYISSGIFWNGEEDYTVSSSLRSVLRKEKGNSADVNMLLIAMLRSLKIKADPVILSTRSNGSINQNSAIMQQFNYLLAYVSIDGKFYLVDATDPLRPFDLLPFDCLNNAGRLISESESKFVDLKNNERLFNSYSLDFTVDTAGNITGSLLNRYSDYTAYNIRKSVKLESEEGYLDYVKSLSANAEISDFNLENLKDRYTDLVMTFKFKINNGGQIAGDEIILNPYLLQTELKNPFYSSERRFPVDYGCPTFKTFSMKLTVPEGYSVSEKPENIMINLGKDDGKFEFSCRQTGNTLEINSEFNINKTVFQPTEYSEIQKFYLKIQQKQAEYIVLKKTRL